MKAKRSNWPAREGQTAIEVACNCDGATLVLDSQVAVWRCGKCQCKPRPTGNTVVLGVDGALPDGWRPEAIRQGGGTPIVEAVA